MSDRLSCFKAYDVRGRVPHELDADLALRIGQAYAEVVHPRRVVVGHDIRLSSLDLTRALIEGLTRSGVDVALIGLCGTEEVYFATSHLKVDGGIMVTASHNPVDYNGMKFVRQESRPISGDSGLREIEAAARRGGLSAATRRGREEKVDTRDAYVKHVLSYVDVGKLRPLKIVVNPGNGCASLALDALEKHLPFHFTKVFYEPDGRFPNGVPNPLLPEMRPPTVEALREAGADLAMAWDGDFDRCFLFDEKGTFIEGYYIVGLLAAQLLRRHPGGKIIHDPRLTWNTLEMVGDAGGKAVQCKSGHAFIKERMRAEDAVYGGEMSAHHYFREFSYCDSGMIPWLLVAEAMSEAGKPLSALVEARMRRFPASGEINRKAPDPKGTIAAILGKYRGEAIAVDETDGVSVELASWRFNLRMSNTEPVVRLNVESRGDESLMRRRTEEILQLMAEMGATE
jgi:phosphomannomutase/phosphomannomutase/phosphoglucomutase